MTFLRKNRLSSRHVVFARKEQNKIPRSTKAALNNGIRWNRHNIKSPLSTSTVVTDLRNFTGPPNNQPCFSTSTHASHPFWLGLFITMFLYSEVTILVQGIVPSNTIYRECWLFFRQKLLAIFQNYGWSFFFHFWLLTIWLWQLTLLQELFCPDCFLFFKSGSNAFQLILCKSEHVMLISKFH